MPKILIVDDEELLGKQLAENLWESGYSTQYECNPLNVNHRLQEFPADLIIVDKLMPKKSGIEVVRDLKLEGPYEAIPIIMLTACKDKNDLLECYQMGVDDFVTKPFDYDELKARIKANLKRHTLHQARILNFKNIQMDTMAQTVRIDDMPVQLTLTEYKLLRVLMTNLETVVPREELIKHALMNMNVVARTVDVHITALRKKIGDASNNIKTIRGVGYKLSA